MFSQFDPSDEISECNDNGCRVGCDCHECMPDGCMDELPADLVDVDCAPQTGDFVISHADMDCPDIFQALDHARAWSGAVAS